MKKIIDIIFLLFVSISNQVWAKNPASGSIKKIVEAREISIPTDAQLKKTPLISLSKRSPLSNSFIESKDIIVGDELRLQISNLIPNSTVQLEISWLIHNQGKMSTKVNYVANADGVIDTKVHTPNANLYGISEPGLDALISVMKWEEDKTVTASPDPTVETFSSTVKDQAKILAENTFKRRTMASDIRVENVTVDGLVGQLFLPKKTGNYPVIITIGGSEGGLGTMTAGLFASRGYASLALAYFGMPGLPIYLENLPIEYSGKALKFLKDHSEINENKIGLMGGSRGGEAALLIGSKFSEIKAVVAAVPSPISWGGTGPQNLPSWTEQNAPLPFMPRVSAEPSVRIVDGLQLYSFIPMFLEGLKNSAAVESAFFSIEKTNGPILFYGGEDDQVWPSCKLIELAEQYLAKHPHSFKDEFYCYKNAGHNIIVPAYPTQTYFFHPALQVYLNMGGTSLNTAKAARDSWEKIHRFFEINIR